MNDRFSDFREEMNDRFSDFRDEIASMLTQLKSDFFERIDPILKEVPASREERTIVTEKVSDHEEKLSKLEKVVNTN